MKFDLARMLKEIKEDTQRPAPRQDRKLTQAQIRQLRKDKEKAREK